jgi:pimeloyl-ACP methyl ester carboxylesterase
MLQKLTSINIIFILFSVLSFNSFADKLVFVQGYLGESSNWKASGIIHQLEANNWSKGGSYHYSQQGLSFNKAKTKVSANQYFTIELPTEASIREQSYYLSQYLEHLRKASPKERLILVGHSAGGVLSRLVMVQNPNLKVSLLITIASPHLGSDLAELANLVGNTPITLFAPLFGAETFNRSQELYRDLLPEQPGRFLYELNRQPHPKAQYVSVIRNPNSADGGDLVVPAYSHDMRNIFALKNKAQSYTVNGGHSLTRSDGVLIFDILTQYESGAVLKLL